MRTTVVSSTRGNKYSAIAEDLRSQILKGEYTHQLPSVWELSKQYHVTNVTIQKALKQLRKDGMIRSIPGQGSFITRLKRRRTHRIGISISNIFSPLCNSLVRGIQTGSQKFEQRLVIETYAENYEKQFKDVEHLVEDQEVDGVILWPHDDYTTAFVDYLEEKKLPFVIVPEPDLNIFANCHTVSNDNSHASSDVMIHLLVTGRRRVGFVYCGDSMEHVYGRHRYSHYERSLKVAGLPVHDPVRVDHLTEEEVVKELSSFDAVFCVNDLAAAKVFWACVYCGVRIPHDLAVTGYDNSPVAQHLNITSVEQHFAKIGSLAIELLMEEIEKGADTPKHLSVESELIIRKSSLPCDE